MFPQHGICRILLNLALIVGYTEISHSQVVFSDDFNSYTAGSLLPLDTKWSSASNGPPLQTTTVEQDSANVFGAGSANKYLKMVSLTDLVAYTMSDATLTTNPTAGCIQFSFFQPTGTSDHGDGFILRIESN